MKKDDEKVKKIASLVWLSCSEVERILFGNMPEEEKNWTLAGCIRNMTKPEEARNLYNSAWNGSEAKKLAFEKWNALALEKAQKATTFEEALDAFKVSWHGGEAQKLALEKLYELA